MASVRGHLKSDVADAVVAFIEPMQQRFHEIRADQAYLNDVMKRGAEGASERASQTLKAVYDAIGLVKRPF